MYTTVEEAIEWIHSRKKFGVRPGLMRIEALLEKCDHPEHQIPTIHVAGTNGKGSTVSFLRSLLAEQGLTVGIFTSPYIERFHERIQIDQTFISDEALVTIVNRIYPVVMALDEDPELTGITEFEILTACAFIYFAQENVDVAVIEVGLGGLYDSTNVITPKVSVITTIGLDHMDILGDTIEEIALQKAGIIKPSVPVVIGNIAEPALSVLKQVAKNKQAPASIYDQNFHPHYEHVDAQWGEWWTFYNEAGRIQELYIPLMGRHQVENASVALEAFLNYCTQMNLKPQQKEIRRGLKQAYWPARMERLHTDPLIIVDGAHNEHAMARLVENMQQDFSQRKIYVLFSALQTKPVTQMIDQLLTIPNCEILLTTFDFPKALVLSDSLLKKAPKRLSFVSLWQVGLGEILEKMQEDDVLLITGSLYFVSEVRAFILTLLEENNG